MSWHHIAYFASIIVTIVIMGTIARYSRRHRDIAGAGTYMWIALLVCLLALFEGTSMISPTREWALFWFNMRVLSFAALPVAWLVFVLQYIGKPRLITKPRVAALFIIPVITQVMIWTNGMHGLWVAHDVAFHAAGPFFIAKTAARVPGPWFMVHLGYTYINMLAGMVLLFVMSARLMGRHRGQAVAMGTGTLVMIVGTLFPTFNLIPGMELNPLPQSFALGALIIAWAVYRYRFLAATPLFSEEKKIPLILAMVFILLAGGIVTTGYLYYRNYKNRFRLEVERQLTSIADLKVSELVQWRKERLGDGGMLNGNAAFTALARRYFFNPADTEAQWMIRNWLDKIQSSYQYASIHLLDVQGVTRMSIPYAAGPVCGKIVQKTWELMRSGGVAFMDFHREAPGKPIHLAVMAPIIDGGASLGLVVLVIDPDTYLYPMINRWPTPSRTAETLLVRREGDDALFLNELKFRKNSALNFRVPLTHDTIAGVMAVKGRTGITEAVDYRGMAVLAALRAVPGSPWFLVARMDIAEVYAPVRERLWLMIVLVCAILAGSGAGVGMLWRRRGEAYYRDRIKDAEALRASESFLDSIIEHSPHSLWISDERGTLIRLNQACRDLLKITDDEVVGKYNVLQDDIVEKQGFMPLVRSVFENGETAKFTLVYDSSRLERVPLQNFVSLVLEVTISPVRDAQGRIAHAIVQHVDITERRRAEEGLCESEARLSAIFETSPAGIILVDPDGRITFANRRMTEMFRCSMRELIGSAYIEHVHPDEKSAGGTAMRNLMTGAVDSVSFERHYTRSDGSDFWGFLNGQRMTDSQGNLVSLAGMITDITERRRAEKAKKKIEERYRFLFENMLDGFAYCKMFYKDGGPVDFMYLEVNDAFGKLTGLKDVAGKMVSEVIPGIRGSDPELFERYSRVASTGRPEIFESYVEALKMWFSISVYSPEKEYFVAVFDVITERKRAEEALQESERKLREAQEMAHLGYWHWDVNTGDVEWSEEVYKIFRIDPKEFTPRIDSILALSPWPEDHERDKELIRRAIESRGPGSYEQKFLRPDKSIGYYFSNFQGNYDEKGDLISIVGTVIDITERKLAEEEIKSLNESLEDRVRERTARLEAVNKELEAFSYSVSHDLRAPLRGIDGFSQVILEDYGDKLDAKGRDYLGRLRTASQRMGRLIDDILKLSRIGRAEICSEDVDLSVIVRAIADELTKNEPERKAEFVITEKAPARGDPALLMVALENLINNAWKFTSGRPSSRIEFGANERGGVSEYFIKDNGAGFDMKYADRLFGPFQRLHSTAEFEGIGIGLALVKRIINRHGGEIRAEGAPGKGSVFYFTLGDMELM